MINSSIEIITPYLAKKILSDNKGNRNLNTRHIKTLSKEMSSGYWKLTGTGISISKSGRLLDGQHRLMAVVDAQVPQQFLVVRGIEDSAQDVIDTTALPRGAHHIFSMRGVKNANVVAAACRIINRWLPDFTYQVSYAKDTQPELDQVFDRFPEIAEWAEIAGGGKFKRLIPTSYVAAYGVLFSIADTDICVHDFFESLSSGAGLSGQSPILLLRNRLFVNASSVQKMTKKHQEMLLIKAFNFTAQGKEIKQLKILSSEEFPKIYGLSHGANQ